MSWVFKKYEELTKEELYAILRLRSQIFVLEQESIYLDLDNRDQVSYHLFFQEEKVDLDSQSMIAAYCRLLPPGARFTEASIGRVLVKKDYRGHGLAKEMMFQAIDFLEDKWPTAGIRLSGQLYLEEFYKSFAFKRLSEIYLEDGLEHIAMVRYPYGSIKYLGHSCFLIETPLRLLLFDYGQIPDRSAWDTKITTMPPLRGRPLYIFSSHQHLDHYHPQTLEIFPQAKFFLHGHDPIDQEESLPASADFITVKAQAGQEMPVYPNQRILLDDMQVFCSGSSDEGTAFLVETPELTTIHAGDLARWDQVQPYLSKQKLEITRLATFTKITGPAQVAMLPVSTSDGYQEEPLLAGLEDSIMRLKPNLVVPMHAHGYEHLYTTFNKWFEKNRSKFKGDSLTLMKPGDSALFELKTLNLE